MSFSFVRTLALMLSVACTGAFAEPSVNPAPPPPLITPPPAFIPPAAGTPNRLLGSGRAPTASPTRRSFLGSAPSTLPPIRTPEAPVSPSVFEEIERRRKEEIRRFSDRDRDLQRNADDLAKALEGLTGNRNGGEQQPPSGGGDGGSGLADRDPLLPPPPPGVVTPAPRVTPLVTPAPRVADKSPIDDDNNLLVDLMFGLQGEDAEKTKTALATRLEALAFAINSINTTTTRLLTVDDLMKQLYPGGGRFREGVIPTGKIDLTRFLTPSQIDTFRDVLSKEPLNCATERSGDNRGRRGGFDDDQPKAEALRADVIVKAIMDQGNYYKLLGLSQDRRGFERDVGVNREFDVDGLAKDQSEDTMRLIIPPGKSGVAHPNAQRMVLLQKSPSGRLVIRTGDVDKAEATRDDRNFVLNPATARPTGSEEIWELPNGLRAYSARNGEGQLVTQVPHGLVMPNITNPRSCFSCHGADDKGYIAMQSAPKKKVKVVDQTIDGRTFGNRNLFKATWEDYEKEIKPANERYAAAMKRIGGSPRAMKALLDQYAGDVSMDKLAKEIGGDKDEIQATVVSRRFRSSWDPTDDFDPKDKERMKDLKLTRAQLETGVDLGAGSGERRNRKPLYCAVRDLSREQQAKFFSEQRPGGDRLVRGRAPVGKPAHTAL